MNQIKDFIGILIAAAIFLSLGGCLVWAIWDWKNSLQHVAFALLFSFAIATIFLLPAFVVHLVRERNFASAYRKSIEFWARLFSDIAGQI